MQLKCSLSCICQLFVFFFIFMCRETTNRLDFKDKSFNSGFRWQNWTGKCLTKYILSNQTNVAITNKISGKWPARQQNNFQTAFFRYSKFAILLLFIRCGACKKIMNTYPILRECSLDNAQTIRTFCTKWPPEVLKLSSTKVVQMDLVDCAWFCFIRMSNMTGRIIFMYRLSVRLPGQ